MSRGTIFLVADHGLAIVYFLQTQVIHRLLGDGYEVLVLVEDSMVEIAQDRFPIPGLSFTGLRLDRAREFVKSFRPETQWWLHFLRRVGGANRINTHAMDSYIEQVAVEQSNWRRMWMPISLATIWLLRRSAWARRALVELQQRFHPRIYTDLLDKHEPELVVASTPGWRLDRFLLREARARGIRTAAVVVGWDNPSSYSIPGANVDFINCWSDIQQQELVLGSDWNPDQVHIGGMPVYDGYIKEKWLLTREQYYLRHNLDPSRKLLSYACSFVSFSPNIQNVEALAELVQQDALDSPSQLLVRLHPNHFANVSLFQDERRRIEELASSLEHVHVVRPSPLGEGAGYYSGEDMDEKSSMMAHADVFLTVYSTMVVEAALHGTPIVSVCIDHPGGWATPRKYSLPLSRIGNWPTHQRFLDSGAGKVVYNQEGLKQAINSYLRDPEQHDKERARFIRDEVTYLDGSAGRRTGDFLVSLARRGLAIADNLQRAEAV